MRDEFLQLEEFRIPNTPSARQPPRWRPAPSPPPPVVGASRGRAVNGCGHEKRLEASFSLPRQGRESRRPSRRARREGVRGGTGGRKGGGGGPAAAVRGEELQGRLGVRLVEARVPNGPGIMRVVKPCRGNSLVRVHHCQNFLSGPARLPYPEGRAFGPIWARKSAGLVLPGMCTTLYWFFAQRIEPVP